MIARGFSCEPQPGQGNRQADIGNDHLGVSLPGIGPYRQEILIDDTAIADFRGTETWRLLLVHIEAFFARDVGASQSFVASPSNGYGMSKRRLRIAL